MDNNAYNNADDMVIITGYDDDDDEGINDSSINDVSNNIDYAYNNPQQQHFQQQFLHDDP
eukprot:CAMPEP_0182493694 /NCGR_PEP_ID=MMETSP1321-20130603/2611_1 /TAXON_ID=91990 /ORGANISM="Bolidomonas sp., Strain RCC1657" /LENGTH=59 /DNA_ID=CAMNT_0024696521 /DNA_START=375 /DNA_END=551 /DNA_ORIENTATION=-